MMREDEARRSGAAVGFCFFGEYCFMRNLRRVTAMFMATLAAFFLLIPPVLAASDPRRAVLVMNAESGEILRQENAHARRYPASLTKMMTLYLLFEALRKDVVRMRTQFPVSKHAAMQPQTNISLRPGEKITVEDCVRALVVRSANDVAVVVAEGLGRSEWNFAVMMTKKARQLGMKNTVFRNPHGLPDAHQYTTAYDMALLGKALRRDFPQYYPYFKTNVFRYRGRTYTGHNRVIGRFEGADGIKTGYIRASGFNLVTSVRREGFNVVAVVMGGASAASRDNEMVALLGRSFAELRTRGAPARAFASAPLPVPNPERGKEPEQVAQAAIPLAEVRVEERGETTVTKAPVKPSFSFHFGGEKKAEAKPKQPPAPSPALAASARRPVPQPGTLEYQMAKLQGEGDVSYPPRDVRADRNDEARSADRASLEPPPVAEVRRPEQGRIGKEFGIQVGAFTSDAQAKAAVRRVFDLISRDLGDAYITISREQQVGATMHRARLGNLSKEQAEMACRRLVALRQSCFTVQME
jgi:D-alanyl-D-alanine carboxypeptidase